MLTAQCVARPLIYFACITPCIYPDSVAAQIVADPYMVADKNVGQESVYDSNPASFCQVGNITYFAAGTADRELWRTDGTPGGTYLVKDISAQGSSTPRDLTEFQGKLYFSAESEVGRELWVSDGTPAGTTIIKDLLPGEESSIEDNVSSFDSGPEVSAGDFTAYNGALYLRAATEPATGFNNPFYYLIRTEGTEETTIQMELEGKTGSFRDVGAEELTVCNDLLFVAFNRKLWKTDGTVAGTAQIPLPTGFTDPLNLTAVGDTLYFSAKQNTSDSRRHVDRELLKSDGTAAGTVLVTELVPGNDGAYMTNFAAYNNKLIFCAGNTEFGPEPWVSDGTPAGTMMLADINTNKTAINEGYGSFPENFTVSNGLMYFGADRLLDFDDPWEEAESLQGRDVYVTDGTPAGTRLIYDFNTSGNKVDPEQFVSYGGHTYFIAENRIPYSGSTTDEVTIYKSDGTLAGTGRMCTNFFYDDNSIRGLFARPDMLLSSGNRYSVDPFRAPLNSELWRSFGTDETTVLLKEIEVRIKSSSPRSGISAGGKLVYSYLDDDTIDLALSDGIPDEVQELNIEGVPVAVAGGKIFYLKQTYDRGFPDENNLYSMNLDGTNHILISDDDFGVYGLDGIVLGQKFIYSARSDDTGDYALYASDGTVAGTEVLNNSDLSASDYTLLSPGLALFVGYNNAHGSEIWKTDGTAAGTQLVKELEAGNDSRYITNLAQQDGKVYFLTNKFISGAGSQTDRQYKLMETDGTAEGTRILLFPLYTVETALGGEIIGTLPGKVFYTFPDTLGESAKGRELWAYDIQSTTTALLKDINPGKLGSLPEDLLDDKQVLSHQGAFYFVATDGTHGVELWKSDGTPGGTVLVHDIAPGQSSSYPENLIAVDDELVFAATDPATGRELYKLSSPEAEPEPIYDINIGPLHSSPREFVIVEEADLFFFSATTASAGRELWALPTDGQLGPPGPTSADLWELYE